jgi:hypothetical protein
MTTEVSNRPTANRSGTRVDDLVDGRVQIVPKSTPVDGRRTPECLHHRPSVDKPAAPQRPKFADRLRSSGHDERATLVEATHYATAVVAQLPLADLFDHSVNRSAWCYTDGWTPRSQTPGKETFRTNGFRRT